MKQSITVSGIVLRVLTKLCQEESGRHRKLDVPVTSVVHVDASAAGLHLFSTDRKNLLLHRLPVVAGFSDRFAIAATQICLVLAGYTDEETRSVSLAITPQDDGQLELRAGDRTALTPRVASEVPWRSIFPRALSGLTGQYPAEVAARLEGALRLLSGVESIHFVPNGNEAGILYPAGDPVTSVALMMPSARTEHPVAVGPWASINRLLEAIHTCG